MSQLTKLKLCAFVRQGGAAFQVFHANLAAKTGPGALRLPLAIQGSGAGKTTLGFHLVKMLQFPRIDCTRQAEAAVVAQLNSAVAWSGCSIEPQLAAALADTRPENIVLRALLACYPRQEDELMRLKNAATALCNMHFFSAQCREFEEELGYGIFLHVFGGGHDDGYWKRPQSPFLAFVKAECASAAAADVVAAIVRTRGALVLGLDSLASLGPRTQAQVKDDRPLESALENMQLTLNAVCNTPGCVVYATATMQRWETVLSPRANTAATLVPVVLPPFCRSDVEEWLRTQEVERAPVQPAGTPAVISASLRLHAADRIARLTGGNGDRVHDVVDALPWWGEPSRIAKLASDDSMDAPSWIEPPHGMLEALNAVIDRAVESSSRPFGGMRVIWDNFSSNFRPSKLAQSRFSRLLALALALDLPFQPSLRVRLPTTSGYDINTAVNFADAAVTLGLRYHPAPAGCEDTGEGLGARQAEAGALPAPHAAARACSAAPSALIRLHASDMWCHALADDLGSGRLVLGDLALIRATQSLPAALLLSALRTFGVNSLPPLLGDGTYSGGTYSGDTYSAPSMRGRPLEALCIEGLMRLSGHKPFCYTHGAQIKTVPLVALLPVLLRGASKHLRGVPVPPLEVVAVPTVSSKAAPLDAADKALLLLPSAVDAATARRYLGWPRINPRSHRAWAGPAILHPLDLPWLLTQWLGSGTVAVPATAAADGSPGWFVRLGEDIICVTGSLTAAAAAPVGAKVTAQVTALQLPVLPEPFRTTLLLLGAFDGAAAVTGAAPVAAALPARAEVVLVPLLAAPARSAAAAATAAQVAEGGLAELMGAQAVSGMRRLLTQARSAQAAGSSSTAPATEPQAIVHVDAARLLDWLGASATATARVHGGEEKDVLAR